MGAVWLDMYFGPAVKPLSITMKKEAGKVVETSDVVRTQAIREFRKDGQEPLEPKRSPKKGAQNFEFSKILNFKILKFSKVYGVVPP